MIRYQTDHQPRSQYTSTQTQHIERELTQCRIPIRKCRTPREEVNEEEAAEEGIEHVERSVEVSRESILV